MDLDVDVVERVRLDLVGQEHLLHGFELDQRLTHLVSFASEV
jgi:hypothetical protein